MKALTEWQDVRRTATGLQLVFANGHLVDIMVLAPRLIRVLVRRRGAVRVPRTWCVNPDGAAGPEGRDRLAVDGFPGADATVDLAPPMLATNDLRVTVRAPLALAVEARTETGWRMVAEDRPAAAWRLGVGDHGCAHALRLLEGDRIWGVGEKAGVLERTGRRFDMRCVDAMGYDAERTDPLYKHLPFTLTRTAEAGWYSLFYDNLAPGWLDLGLEIDNYHPRFRSFRAEDGDLDLYFRWDPDPEVLVRAQSALTGGVAFPPKWSLGYSGSTMQYTDAEDAQDRLLSFVERCGAESIPCDSFHLSSGYTAIGHRRYVFNWNRDRIPDPEGLAARFAAAGVKLIPNIKPVLLSDHPLYAEARDAGLFVRDGETGAPERSPFWDGEGSHLDFTNPATQGWWATKVKRDLLDRGLAATWNDNNEFQVGERGAQCAGFGEPLDIEPIRPVHTLGMLHASHAAQTAHAADKRPYLVTRSGCAGLQSLAQTWSGDNRTAWPTIRYNQRMGLSLALCGISNTGHDVGGFAGPRPDAELFLRWVQNGVLHPRFSIHSWNVDGTVTEPWSFPEVTDAVRAAIALRYRLLPYLYTLLWAAHVDHRPMIQPTFLAFPDDAATYEECDEFMLGPDLLVATVMEEGASRRTLRLPDLPCGWWDFHGGRPLAGGQTLDLAVTRESIPLFARGGAVIPTSTRVAHVDATRDTTRRLLLFPTLGEGSRRTTIFDDDGESTDWQARHLRLDTELAATAEGITLEVRRAGSYVPAYPGFEIELPVGETRPLLVNGRPSTGFLALADIPNEV